MKKSSSYAQLIKKIEYQILDFENYTPKKHLKYINESVTGVQY